MSRMETRLLVLAWPSLKVKGDAEDRTPDLARDLKAFLPEGDGLVHWAFPRIQAASHMGMRLVSEMATTGRILSERELGWDDTEQEVTLATQAAPVFTVLETLAGICAQSDGATGVVVVPKPHSKAFGAVEAERRSDTAQMMAIMGTKSGRLSFRLTAGLDDGGSLSVVTSEIITWG